MIKKILKWLFYITLTLVLGIGASLYLFKDRIINQVLTEVNNYLAVPVEVSKVDIDFFYGLPNISIAFYDIELPASTEPIIKAKRFYAIVNPIEILRGQLNVNRIEIVDAELQLYIDSDNRFNINEIFKSSDDQSLSKADTSTTSFSLNTIVFKNVNLNYINDFSKTLGQVEINELSGNFQLVEGVYQTKVVAEFDVREYKSPSWTAKDVGVFNYDFDINYQTEEKILTLDKSRFTFRGAEAGITGNIILKNASTVDLQINADAVSFKMLSDLLPAKMANYIKQYESSGSIGLSAALEGSYTNTTMPSLNAELIFKDVDLTNPKFDANIHNLDLSCFLSFSDIGKLSTGKFRVAKSSGLLLEKPFSLTFELNNFSNPTFKGNIKAGITTTWLMSALQLKNYDSGTGGVDLSLDIDNIESDGALMDNLNISGLVNLQDVSFSLNDTVRLEKVSGQARFNPQAINLTNINLNWLGSDLVINGEVIDHLAFDNINKFTLRSDIKAEKLIIEDVVSLVRASSELFVPDTSQKSDVQLDLDLVASLDSLTFQRFKGAKVTGEIIFQDEVLEVVDLNGKAMGGTIRVNGKMKTMPNKDIVIQANAKTKAVYVDSLFYVFNNFTQDFIRDENLKGKVYADIDASMYFDQNWRFRRQLLSAYAKIGIVGGELNEFKPIMALSDYLDDKDDNLSSLRFSDLVTNVTIKEDTVFIPEISIRTNVRNIALGGYHTLDQHINYQLAVPIINERVDKDEAFGAVQKSSKGSPNLLFRIKGTTSNYKVNYDLLRATGNVLKLLDITKIFKKKEEAEVDSSFLNDEDFDWRRDEK